MKARTSYLPPLSFKNDGIQPFFESVLDRLVVIDPPENIGDELDSLGTDMDGIRGGPTGRPVAGMYCDTEREWCSMRSEPLSRQVSHSVTVLRGSWRGWEHAVHKKRSFFKSLTERKAGDDVLEDDSMDSPSPSAVGSLDLFLFRGLMVLDDRLRTRLFDVLLFSSQG